MNNSIQGNTFFSAFRAHIDAFRWIRSRNHRAWYVYAAGISVGLIALNYWGAQILHGWVEFQLNEFLNGWTTIATADDSLYVRMQSAARDLFLLSFDVVFWILTFWLKLKITKYLVLACVGPLMSWVSEQAECEIRGVQYDFRLRFWIRDFARSMAVAFICFAIETSMSFLMLAFIGISWLLIPLAAPVVTVVLGIAAALLSAFFYGLSVFDPIWERRGFGLRMRIRQSVTMKASVLGAGLPFHLWMSIPYLSAIISPIMAPVLCSVAAVLISDRRGWESVEVRKEMPRK